MVSNFIDKKLVERFKNEEVFTRNDLFDFYRFYVPEMKEGAFAWRIFDLKRKLLIEPIKKGIYKLSSKETFKPNLDKNILAIGKILGTSFNHYVYNIWTTAWLNELIELQATNSITVLEVDKSSVESVFYTLKDKKFENVFFKPDETVIEKYISELNDSIIIKPMITRAPTFAINTVIIPTLEKILVDLYCDEKIYFAFQGRQLVKIYEASIEKYSINFSKMFNYAKRRKREKSLKEFMLNNLYDKIKDLIE